MSDFTPPAGASGTSDTDKWFKLGIWLTFYLSASVAITHLFWFFMLPTFPELQGMTPIQWDFVKLLNLCIVLMMLFFTAVSGRILFAAPFSTSHTRFFCSAMSAFWLGRVILEFLFPVRIPLLYTDYTSAILKVLGIVIVVLLSFPEGRLQQQKRRAARAQSQIPPSQERQEGRGPLA